MAVITGKSNLFFVTSPRSPYKMKDEVDVLVRSFSGHKWTANPELQVNYYRLLANQDFFTGSLEGELDFKARDRITRGPKALGLVDLDPIISLTDAGSAYIYGPRPYEIFTRQLLKFQFPSPFHTDSQGTFFIRPYLELLRLVYELDGLTKDEIAAFVIQCIHIKKYDEVKIKIEQFRSEAKHLDRDKTNYKRFFDEVLTRQIETMYAEKISQGATKTRESKDSSQKKFIITKKSNHRDYADAAIRYLRETRLVSFRSSRSNKIYIPEDKKAEVEFILKNIPREPVYTNDKAAYKAYLFDSQLPLLYTDDKTLLVEAVLRLSPQESPRSLADFSIEELKDRKEQLTTEKREQLLNAQKEQLQLYNDYTDIIGIYEDIRARNVVDAPLLFEWNTWRAFVMLNDGEIAANFRFDDTGLPLYTAPGNQADIVCEYEDFSVIVEVTLSTGATQHTMEGEPVARHLGKHKSSSGKDSYCIFIAKSLHDATLAHFFFLHKVPISLYGGTSKIIPIELADFKVMLERAYNKTTKPTATHIKAFVQQASDLALASEDENKWFRSVKQLAHSWI